MSMSLFQDHREHLAEVDAQSFLGSICWYSVRTTRVFHTTLRAQLDNAGFDKVLCRPPADSDVFRRVFSNGHRRTHSTDQEDVKENLLVRTVKNSSDRIVKRVVREVVDGKGETLAYDEVLDIQWAKSHPGRIDIVELTFNDNAWTLANELRNDYYSERGCINSDGIRNIVRRVLDSCRATCVREGGAVFFVAKDYSDKLANLSEITNLVPGCDFHSLPLIDDRQQRDMIRKSFQSEAAEDLDRMLVEMDEAIEKGDVSAKRFSGFQERFAEMRAKATEYSKVLEEEIELETFRVAMLQNRLKKMFAKSMEG